MSSAYFSEDYVHRIGRTGRIDNKGTAYTFFTYQNGRQAKDLVKVLEEAKQTITPELYKMAMNNRGGFKGNARGKNELNIDRQGFIFLNLVLGRYGLGKRAFQSYDRQSNSFGGDGGNGGSAANKRMKFSDEGW